jgi:hypothetical protein
MPGQYDYTINIPQPPAQNFLQSLLGIQQLKGLQQQGEIAQQQAGIQAQQAQFAQQKQPLELQQIQAGIAAQQAAAAHSGAATNLLGIQTAEAQRKNQDIAAYQNEALKLAEDPTSWDANKLKSLSMKAAAIDPQSFSAMNSLFQHLPQTANTLSNAASEVMLSVNAGKPDIAKSSLDNYIAGAQAAVNKNPADQAAQASLTFLNGAKSTLDKDPTGASAALQASNFLFNTDPAKWDLTTKALKGASDISKTQADIKETQAKAMKEQWAAVKMSQEIENGKPMSRPVTNIVDAATTASQSYGKISETAQSLRSELESLRSKMNSGKFSLMGKEAWKSGMGTQDEVSNFLTGFDRLVTSDLFKSLKDTTRGNMNVQELKTVGGTVPGKYDSAQRKAEYLDALVSVFDRQTQLESDKANFVSTFNTNGKATKDGEVSGIPVSKGTTLNDFLAQRKKELGAIKVFGGASQLTAPAQPAYAPPTGVTIKSVR